MNPPFSPSYDAANPFQDYAEAQATATVRALLAQAAMPALTELEALRAAIDMRCESLAATLAGAATIDPAPIHELVARLAHAAGEEAGAAARAARALALEEADARLQIDRAEAQKQLDAMRAEAAEERSARQAEQAALADALAEATRQADAIRAERDGHLDALNAARAQAETIRADRDAQLDALRAAQAQVDALRIESDAQTEAVRAATERAATFQAERDAHLLAANAAREEARKTQGEQDFLLEAARISNVRHAKLLEQAQAEVDAARSRAETAHAQLLTAQAEVEAMQAQLAAAQAEAEQRLAVGAREIEALRDELERVRVEMQEARMAAVAVAVVPPVAQVAEMPQEVIARIAEPAPEPTAEPQWEPEVVLTVEPEAAPVVEFVEEPAREWPAVQLVEQTDAVVIEPEPQAEPVLVAAVPEPEPVREATAVDPVGVMYRAIGGAADLSQVLDALVDGVGALFPRAALFVVKTKSKRLQGWRSVGFTGPAAITREFEFPLATDSALTRAVTASRTIFTGEGQTQPGHEAWTVTFPVTTGGRVVAVVHADGGARNGAPAQAFDRATALDLGHTLVRMAGERIGALTLSARTAFGSVMSAAPATVVAHTAPAAVDPGDAGRYASQLVSEINRYSQAAATVTPADQGLQERLAERIEVAAAPAVVAAAPAAAPAVPATALGLFDEALSKMLGNSAMEPASAAIQPV